MLVLLGHVAGGREGGEGLSLPVPEPESEAETDVNFRMLFSVQCRKHVPKVSHMDLDGTWSLRLLLKLSRDIVLRSYARASHVPRLAEV